MKNSRVEAISLCRFFFFDLFCFFLLGPFNQFFSRDWEPDCQTATSFSTQRKKKSVHDVLCGNNSSLLRACVVYNFSNLCINGTKTLSTTCFEKKKQKQKSMPVCATLVLLLKGWFAILFFFSFVYKTCCNNVKEKFQNHKMQTLIEI